MARSIPRSSSSISVFWPAPASWRFRFPLRRRGGRVLKRALILSVGAVAASVVVGSAAGSVSLLSAKYFDSIRDEASGELPLVDFRNIVNRYTGFAPSRGGDQIAEYIAGRVR